MARPPAAAVKAKPVDPTKRQKYSLHLKVSLVQDTDGRADDIALVDIEELSDNGIIHAQKVKTFTRNLLTAVADSTDQLADMGIALMMEEAAKG